MRTFLTFFTAISIFSACGGSSRNGNSPQSNSQTASGRCLPAFIADYAIVTTSNQILKALEGVYKATSTDSAKASVLGQAEYLMNACEKFYGAHSGVTCKLGTGAEEKTRSSEDLKTVCAEATTRAGQLAKATPSAFPKSLVEHYRSMSTRSAFPDTGAPASDDYTVIDRPIPADLQARFEHYRKAIFNNLPVEFRSCISTKPGAGGVMGADYANKRICYFSDEVENLVREIAIEKPSELLNFILVHELSHFVHEASLRIDETEKRTLLGHPSLYSWSLESLLSVRLGISSLDEIKPEQAEAVGELSDEYARTLAPSHAEVDLYAYIAFSELKETVPHEAIMKLFDWMEKESNSEGIVNHDVRARREILKQYFPMTLR